MSKKLLREFIFTLLSENSELDSAQVISQYAHRNQKRRTGEPYFLHPQEVANIVKNYYSDVETYYTAMLHDALEDGIPLGNIKDEKSFFDMLESELPDESIESIDKIYNSVVDMTKPSGADYFEYIISLLDNPVALRVKISDMMQNISDSPSPNQVLKYSKAKEVLVDYFKGSNPPGISKKHWLDFISTIEKATQDIN